MKGKSKRRSIAGLALAGVLLLSSCGQQAVPAMATVQEDGKSAYELAVSNGYDGTEVEWLASLVGETGERGKSAYEVALDNGYPPETN